MGGGNALAFHIIIAQGGLSPRGRGKPKGSYLHSDIDRSIPAWAGETGVITTTIRKSAVYPRVGGGNLMPPANARNPAGLSPRGRGKPYNDVPDPPTIGSIPAWAGETVIRKPRHRG